MPGEASASFCVMVPAYNEAARIEPVLTGIRHHAEHVVVIDDGSTDNTGDLARSAGCTVLRHEKNLGKGASLMTGFAYAREQGFEAVITIDADGQHDPACIPRFVETWQRTRIPALIGNRFWDRKKIPLVRRWTNLVMSALLSRVMKTYLPDTQCGFRLLQTSLLPYLPVASQRFAMESEILLQLAVHGFRMDSVRIPVVYSGQTSRIRPVVDSFRFVTMLLRYVTASAGRTSSSR
jgi:glycosyltransferase involved in cell wall biosynthesis